MKIVLFSKIGERGRTGGKSGASTVCPGRRARGVLMVDCRRCGGRQDLSDTTCLRGALRLLAAEPSGVREVLLSRDWEIAYDAECTAVLLRLSEVLRFCQGLEFEERFDDCPTCRSNPRSVVSRVIESLPRPAPELEDAIASPGGHGRACEQCMRALRTNLDHARNLLALAEERSSKAAYRVVPSHEH